jgi:four helix bundle protein
VKEIYITTAKFPAAETYGLVSQMRRAAVSICANLAEGSTRKSYKEQVHFSTIAYGSLVELLNHMILSADLGFLENEESERLRNLMQPLSVRINNLRNSQAAKSSGA